jgi:site-specific recombinase XerD
VKRPDFPLGEAVSWFLADMQSEVMPTTLATYRSHLTRFCAWLAPARRTLAAIEPETVESYLRGTRNGNTKMNKAIALRSFAKYLARRKLWFAGTDDAPLSVLRDVKQPRPSDKGMPGYRDAELRTIVRAVDEGPNRYRNRAVIFVELHGFRSKEVRLLLLRNVAMPGHDQLQGHFVIETEAGTKRGSGGVRAVPMERCGRDAIRDYLQVERPGFSGVGDEPLFLTEDGRPFTAAGWSGMARRLQRRIAAEGVAFKQHRLRPTRARQLHEAGWPDTAIMEALGWKSLPMLRRYLGTIPLSRLKQYPMTLDGVFGRAS